MSFVLSQRSRDRMKGVHPALVAVIEAAIARSPVDFMVTEGLRTAARQAALVKAGASRTFNSRHLTGHAVDLAAIVDGQIRWDWPLYPRIASAVKAASAGLKTPLVWGGDWTSLRDGPHFELDRRFYP
jgi:peptidoglycan L-alanyl-D-glutamate endopeptidase CwlK